jgi:hypothetical protein
VIGVEIAKWPEKKCTRQSVPNAERNVKSPSNLTQADRFTAESAGPRNEVQAEDSRILISAFDGIFRFSLFPF